MLVPALTQLAPALRQDLLAAHFTTDAVAELLGSVATAALEREQTLPARLALRAAEPGPLRTLTQLFVAGGRVSAAAAGAALAEVGLAAAFDGALLVPVDTAGQEVRAGLDLAPFAGLQQPRWLLSDLPETFTGSALETEHVLGVGGASTTLAGLVGRSPAGSAVDLGTGSGVQALLLAEHCGAVVGTDVSERALGFAAANAALNELDLDLRAGSMWEPVAGEEFEVVVSNPPFVITARDPGLAQYTYRDGGAAGDAISAAAVRGAAAHLAPGGRAYLLANWEVARGQRWQEVVQGWIAPGVDYHVVQREVTDPALYVETWLRDGGSTPDRDPLWEAKYATWLADFERRRIREIGFGYVLLHRPVRPRQVWGELETLTHPIEAALGARVEATFAVADWLGDPDRSEVAALAEQRLQVAADVTQELHQRPGAGGPEAILLRQGGGWRRVASVSTLTAAAVGACDGELSVGQIAGALARLEEAEVSAVLAELAQSLPRLWRDGFLASVAGV